MIVHKLFPDSRSKLHDHLHTFTINHLYVDIINKRFSYEITSLVYLNIMICKRHDVH